MTDLHGPADRDDADAPDGLEGEAVRVASALRVASVALSVPALVVAIGAAIGLLVLLALVGTAVADGATAFGWILLGLPAVALVVDVIFALRVRATLAAGKDRYALAADLVGLVDIEDLTTATLADLAELTSRTGGLRAVSRARALWRILRRLDVGEHTARFERAKWFLPPMVGETWLLAQIVTWAGLVAWVMAPVTIGLRAAGTI